MKDLLAILCAATLMLLSVSCKFQMVHPQNTNVSETSSSPIPATVKNILPKTGGTPSSKTFYAPYVDMTLWPVYDLPKAVSEIGIRSFVLGFIVAAPDQTPSWGGYSEYRLNGGSFDLDMKSRIDQTRSHGGDVIISLGGAAGQELAEVITDEGKLKDAYLKVVTSYGVHTLDFDIEGEAVANLNAIERRFRVLASLQSANAILIWLTLPVLPSGLTPDGVSVIQSAIRNRVNLTGINIMTMDFGNDAAPDPSGKMGDYTIQSAKALFGQLQSAYGKTKSSEQLWNMIGITPMIGMNDETQEIFDQYSANQTLTFAGQNHIGRISMWSLNRDLQNSQGKLTWVDIQSSSLVQQPYEFSKIFLGNLPIALNSQASRNQPSLAAQAAPKRGLASVNQGNRQVIQSVKRTAMRNSSKINRTQETPVQTKSKP
jgi:chitinase